MTILEPDSALAHDVLAAARRVDDPAGRFGDRKVFISAVWEELKKASPWLSGAGLHGFKVWLIDAERMGLVLLARVDMPGALTEAQRQHYIKSWVYRGCDKHCILAAA